MDIESLKHKMQRDFLKFSILLTTISSVLPTKAATITNDGKQPNTVFISALPQHDNNAPTVNLADSLSSNSDLAGKYLEQMKDLCRLKADDLMSFKIMPIKLKWGI